MIKVSTTGMVVSLKTDLRFPIPGQQGHGGRIIHLLKRINGPIYIKYLNTLLNTITTEGNTIQQLLASLDFSTLDLYKVIALGIKTGQLILPLKENIINYNMEVRKAI